MRGVAKDSSSLELELVRVDSYLASVIERSSCDKLFLCGEKPSHIDCEVLPKLHQVRVAAEGIKGRLHNFILAIFITYSYIIQYSANKLILTNEVNPNVAIIPEHNI